MNRRAADIRRSAWILAAVAVIWSGCGPERENFRDLEATLVDQQGREVQFPGEFEGAPVVIGFIYTHCPDICSLVTANVKAVGEQGPSDATYILISFDPERDTPEVLANYAAAFDMEPSRFRFLTGQPEQVQRVLERMTVRVATSFESTTEAGDRVYFLSHSDKILLLDERLELVMDYGGSMTAPRLILEDLGRL